MYVWVNLYGARRKMSLQFKNVYELKFNWRKCETKGFMLRLCNAYLDGLLMNYFQVYMRCDTVFFTLLSILIQLPFIVFIFFRNPFSHDTSNNYVLFIARG